MKAGSSAQCPNSAYWLLAVFELYSGLWGSPLDLFIFFLYIYIEGGRALARASKEDLQ